MQHHMDLEGLVFAGGSIVTEGSELNAQPTGAGAAPLVSETGCRHRLNGRACPHKTHTVCIALLSVGARMQIMQQCSTLGLQLPRLLWMAPCLAKQVRKRSARNCVANLFICTCGTACVTAAQARKGERQQEEHTPLYLPALSEEPAPSIMGHG